MNKFLKGLGVFAFVLLVTLSTACGKDEKKNETKKEDNKKAYVGTYKLEYYKFVGDEEKQTDEVYTLTLKEDGTGSQERDDYTYNVTWKVKGDKVVIEEHFAALTNEYTGTLKDGKLDVFNGDPKDDFTAEFVYNKE